MCHLHIQYLACKTGTALRDFTSLFTPFITVWWLSTQLTFVQWQGLQCRYCEESAVGHATVLAASLYQSQECTYMSYQEGKICTSCCRQAVLVQGYRDIWLVSIYLLLLIMLPLLVTLMTSWQNNLPLAWILIYTFCDIKQMILLIRSLLWHLKVVCD